MKVMLRPLVVGDDDLLRRDAPVQKYGCARDGGVRNESSRLRSSDRHSAHCSSSALSHSMSA